MDDVCLDVNVERVLDTVVLTLVGSMDVSNARSLADIFDAQWEDNRPLEVVAIDLRGLKFLDSVGIGMLIRCRRQANIRDSALVLITQDTDAAAVLLRATGLLNAFTVVADPPSKLDPALARNAELGPAETAHVSANAW